MFHNDDETPAYKFLDISTSIGQPKEIQATVGSSVIHALVYDYNIFMAGQQIKLKAIKPLGEFAYLTKIRNPSNPYILSDSAIRATLDLWQKNDNEIKEARQDIEKKLNELHDIEKQIKNASDTSIIESLSLSKKKLLLTVVTRTTGLSFESILFKISNEKAYYLSHLAAVVCTNNVLEEGADFIHVHHFGNELSLIRQALDRYNHPQHPTMVVSLHSFNDSYGGYSPTMIKTLHGLNTKVTHYPGENNPICDGIKAADVIHVVSPGSLKELKEDIESGHYFYPESKTIDLNKVFVATNGIDHEKLSLASNWKAVKEKFPEELKSFPNNIGHLSLYEQKQLFKQTLAKVLSGSVKDILRSSSWCKYFDPNKTIMLFVGRFCKEKAHERLEIAAKVAKQKGAHLAIMGFGDPVFEAKIQKDYPEVIFLNTPQDQKIIGNFLRGGADICLLTSNQETAGLVLLEGQTMGQTVLTSSLPGPMSLSNPETFHQFNIAIKDNIVDKDSEFEYVDEKATRDNFYVELEKLIGCFAQFSKEEVIKNIASNIEFAKKFTTTRMVDELNVLYVAGRDMRDSRITL